MKKELLNKALKREYNIKFLFLFFILFNSLCIADTIDLLPYEFLPPTAHQMISKSILNNSIEIEDGSIWKIRPYDEHKITSWLTSDPLIITQNQRWFSSYRYRIINKYNQSSVEVNLSQGPIKNGPRTLYIEAMNLENGFVYLNNFTQWKIDSKDLQALQTWRERDAVIIGENSDFFSNYEAILINVAENKSVRIQQF